MREKQARKGPSAAPLQHRLREMLRAQAEALQDNAIRSGGQVSSEQLESLQRLVALVEIGDRAQPKPSRDRLSLIVAVAATLLILSILLFERRDSTEIELEAEVDQLSFVVPAQELFSESLNVSALGASGLSRIQLPRAYNQEARTLTSPQSSALDVVLAATTDSKAQGEMNLPDLVLPGKTHLWLQKTTLPRQYRLTLEGTALDLRANVSGTVQVSLAGGTSQQLTFVSPKPVIFESGQRSVNLDLTLSSLPHTISAMPMRIEDFSLLRVEDRQGPGGAPVRLVSTILSGSIFFDELNGEELKLRPREAIHLEHAEGEISFLQLKDDRMAVQFHGRVRGMRTGSIETGRSLMPTWLEWLKARRGLYLFWGACIYVLGLIAGFLRWLKGV